jgi:hypothetical protein
MSRLAKPYPFLAWMLLLPLTTPGLAHNIRIAGDVAATFHIAPNHNPKTGEPSQAWFALTHKGGAIIPLAQCDCKLAVHVEPHQEGDPPLLTPVLKAISTERYQGIPSAEITFPKPGEYELELSGKPKASAQFQPFKLSYKVTATTGSSSSHQSSMHQDRGAPNPAVKENKTSGTTPKIPLFIPAILIAISFGIGTIWVLQHLRKSS